MLEVQLGQSRSLLEAVSQTITLFMPLKSDLFKGDPKLEACALHDSAHISPGMSGEQVGKIQTWGQHHVAAGLRGGGTGADASLRSLFFVCCDCLLKGWDGKFRRSVPAKREAAARNR